MISTDTPSCHYISRNASGWVRECLIVCGKQDSFNLYGEMEGLSLLLYKVTAVGMEDTQYIPICELLLTGLLLFARSLTSLFSHPDSSLFLQ